MTTDEIKSSTNMSDVLNERGIVVRNGMCKCPFHDDRKPSMKVYRDGCRCFTCAQSWDVFDFVMQYDGVSFKEAFKSLGGSYKHENKRESILAKGKREQAVKERNAAKMVQRELFHELNVALTICKVCDQVFAPMSEEWCVIKNMEPIIVGFYEMKFIDGTNEVSDLDVYRECRQFRQRFIP